MDPHEFSLTRRELLKLGAATGMTAAGLGPLGCGRGESKDQIVVSRPEEMQTLDASGQFHLSNYNLFLHVFDFLVEMDPDGKYVPSLAESWETSPDGLAWTFKLKKGVKFHNGDPFTSKSVKFSLERLKDRKLARAIWWTDLDRVDTPDDYTAIVRTVRPFGTLLSNLITPTVMYSEKQAEKDGPTFYEKVIGTGPFRFVEWKKGERFVMEMNPDHWRQPLPKIKKITHRPIMEDTTRLSALRTGELTMADTLPADQVKVLQSDDKLQVVRVLAWDQLHLGLKCDQPPFDKVEARQALNYAIDRQAIVGKILEGGRVSSASLPPGIIGYHDGLKPHLYDPDKAKSLLAKAGYKGGKLRFIGPQAWYLKIKEVTEAIAGQLKAVGLDTDLTLMEGGAFVQARTAGNYNIYVTGMAIWDPDQFMEQRIRGDVFKCGYRNQKVFDMILEGRTTVDQAKRGEIYKRAQEILYEEGPMVWLYQMEIIYGLKKSLKGVTFYPFKVWDLRKAEMV